jgi:hypothetical protein
MRFDHNEDRPAAQQIDELEPGCLTMHLLLVHGVYHQSVLTFELTPDDSIERGNICRLGDIRVHT